VYTPAPAAPTAKKSNTVGIVAALAVGALVGGVSGAGVAAWAISANEGSQSSASSTPQNITVNDTDHVNVVSAVAAKAEPSVVTISVSGTDAAGTGSGVILSKDGYVLTNTHVVTLDGETADPTVQVTLADGRLFDAELIGTDPTVDLAVIKLKDASDLTPAEFADSSKLNVGETAIAIGAPLGLSNTVTDGIVSALNRSITVASSAAPENEDESGEQEQQNGQDGPFDFWSFPRDDGEQQQAPAATSTISLPVIQTDAAINPGNSGGALLDSTGKVIGINVAIASAGSTGSSTSGSIGVGFAIPSNLAERVADEIIKNGSATHGLLGASVVDVTGADNSATVGAVVKELSPAGAAEQAGLRVGDVITAFNGATITGSTDLTAQVRYQPAGGKASLTYTRDGKSSTVDVTLGTLK
jgi:putative serine protease PepD